MNSLNGVLPCCRHRHVGAQGQIISAHSGQTFDKVLADADRDYWMTAQEAQAYGMVDHSSWIWALVSPWITGHRWNIANDYLTLTLEVCCTLFNMPIYNITTENSLGFSHSGEVMACGKGSVELTDEEVRQLIELIREHDGSDDVEVLGLEGRYPDLYKKLDDASREIAYDAEYEHWILEGYYNEYYDVDLDEVMDMCAREYDFHFECNPKDFVDEVERVSKEYGNQIEWTVEDAAHAAKIKAFYEWVADRFDKLDRKAGVHFLAETFQLAPDLSDFHYSVVIPEDIVGMARTTLR